MSKYTVEEVRARFEAWYPGSGIEDGDTSAKVAARFAYQAAYTDLYDLAVKHGASEAVAAGFAHSANGEMNEPQSCVYTIAQLALNLAAKHRAVPEGWMLVPEDIHPVDAISDCAGIRSKLASPPSREGFPSDIDWLACWWERITSAAPSQGEPS